MLIEYNAVVIIHTHTNTPKHPPTHTNTHTQTHTHTHTHTHNAVHPIRDVSDEDHYKSWYDTLSQSSVPISHVRLHTNPSALSPDHQTTCGQKNHNNHPYSEPCNKLCNLQFMMTYVNKCSYGTQLSRQ